LAEIAKSYAVDIMILRLAPGFRAPFADAAAA
jgi:hypothetical protein